ncbi:stage II sporulation protein M [Candidatus Woesearchaeota archaeon]|nr:stage II sporulation protein M [Candidatus Woesearchaeota archaeon]
MVLEDLFNPGWVRRRPYLAFVFGFVFTFVAFLISRVFFRSSMSVAMIFLTTLLLIPTLIMLLRMEEQVEGKYGLKHFFHNHKDIFEVYLFSFLGVFAAFVVLGLAMQNNPASYDQLFDFQTRFLSFQQGLSAESVQAFVQGGYDMGMSHATSLFIHDLLVVLICFVLSFFYGASAIFLIILNGSVFANFIIFVTRTIAQNAAQGVQAFFIFMIHLIPEISGFLIAAIAGGVVSKAVLYEKKGSARFKNVFKDATILMLIAMCLVLLSSLLEVFVTARLFKLVF